MYRVAVDIGGTFTDCVVVGSNGDRSVSKSLTTHESLSDGVLAAVRVNADQLGTSVEQLLGETSLFVHGTTVGTNAVVTRTGAKTGLITTKGHEDAFIIGKVFAKRAGLSERDLVHASGLNKPRPPLVPPERIRGIAERVDVEGDIVVELNEIEAIAAIEALVAEDVESIAVSFLWSFVNPVHELRVKELLAEHAPGVFVTASSDIAPVLGEYERTATAVLNAYVGPKVAGYLDDLERRLRDSGLRRPLLVMQSSGGLTSVADARARPIVTLDSGPTGGILGCDYLSDIYGEPNVICTDVGGTSFEVGLIIRGEVPLEPEPVVAQYSFRIPKVGVRSIGAGGGSIAWLDEGGLLRVGPHSAGSSPGPACYGQGGQQPTVTDADLVLGYLDPNNFLGGRMSLDVGNARAALATLGRQLDQEPEEVALGIFRIINSHMADLIRKSTIEQGHDPRGSVLVAYGGAGPMHAVFYGNDIGAKATLVLADSSVFSAVGMLTCDMTHTAQVSQPFASPFSDDDSLRINEHFRQLELRILEQFGNEGVERPTISLRRAITVRYKNQVHTVEIEVPSRDLTVADNAEIQSRFADRYRQQYGEASLYAAGALEFEGYRVTGTHAVEPTRFLEREPAGADPSGAQRGERPVHFDETGPTATAIFDGALLGVGNRVNGPAIIERMGDTVVIPPGFRAEVDPYLTLVLSSVENEPSALATAAVQRGSHDKGGPMTGSVSDGQRLERGEVDPVTFEVVRHRLWAINDEQAMIAARISATPVVYEAYDFNAALLSAEGEGLVAGIYIVHHAVPIDIFVRQIRERWKSEDIQEGDMFFTNDPWSGALHANDGILASPIFYDGEIVCWTGMVMHDQDVGSPVPGSFVVGAADRFGEAPLMPPIKMVERFAIRDDIEQAFLRNHRTPEFNALNMRARVAALSVTHNRIHELINEYGKETFLACQQQIIDYTERVVRRRLREIPDGTWFEHTYIDHDGNQNELYEIRLSLTKREDRIILDFTGTAPQAPGPINCARSGLEGAAFGVFFIFLCYDLPWSVGAARRIVEILSEEGTINNAQSPAAVSMASVMGTWATQDAASNAFAKMLLSSKKYRVEAQACWQPSINGQVIAGLDRGGEPFATILMDCCGGGAGARTFDDGIDSGGFMQSMSATISNVETNESRYPVLQVYRRERPNSGGHGRFRGGLSIEYGLLPHKSPVDLADVVFASGVSQPEGHGISGGGPASVAANFILRSSNVREIFARGESVNRAEEVRGESVEVLAAKDQTLLRANDLHVCRLSGGGGYGDPLRRDPARVLSDVIGGRVSEEIARSIYGVVLTDGSVAERDTEQLRNTLRRERLEGAAPVTKVSERTIDEATPLHPVVDTIEAVDARGERRLRCTVCHQDLGGYHDDYKQWTVMRERSITSVSPLNELGLCDVIVLREFYCPGCGTAVAVDVQKKGEPILPECRFGVDGDVANAPADEPVAAVAGNRQPA